MEFWLVLALARSLGWLPRGVARGLAEGLAALVYWSFGRLRRVGLRNLELALPELPLMERRRILRGVYRSLGRQLVEFCRMTAVHAGEYPRLDWHGRTGQLPGGAGAGQGRAGGDRAPGGVGAFEFLSLADGLSDGDGDSAAG